MAFVLDSSVARAWLLPDENNDAADALVDWLESEAAVVPATWRLEVGNVLVVARRRERLTDKDVERLLAVLVTLPIEQEPAPDDAALTKLMRIACEHGLTSYDAAYVEVARRRGIPLATLGTPVGGLRDAGLRQDGDLPRSKPVTAHGVPSGGTARGARRRHRAYGMTISMEITT
jgi:predicted nucleic acid-binding protein